MSHPMLPLIDANLVESVRETPRWQKGGELIERDGVLLAVGSTRFPVAVNGALRVDRSVAPGDFLAAARACFAERRRGFTVWIRPEVDEDVEAAALAAGFFQLSTSPWMVLEAPLASAAPPPGLEIREARDERGVLDARDVNREAYTSLQMPAAEVDALYAVPRRALGASNRILVGYADGRPVSTAMLIFTHGVAGVYWVGTVEAARGKGYAAAMTRAVSNLGFEAGGKIVTLQASVMGEPIYRRLGYREIGRQKWLLSPKPVKA